MSVKREKLEPKETKILEITVPVYHLEHTLIFRTHVASGTIGEDKFELTMNIMGGGLYVSFKDEMYMIKTEELIRETLEGVIKKIEVDKDEN